MRKVVYLFLAFLAIYITIFSGTFLAAFLFYKKSGIFLITGKDLLAPIKPAIIALIIQILVAKLLPAKNDSSKEDE